MESAPELLQLVYDASRQGSASVEAYKARYYIFLAEACVQLAFLLEANIEDHGYDAKSFAGWVKSQFRYDDRYVTSGSEFAYFLSGQCASLPEFVKQLLTGRTHDEAKGKHWNGGLLDKIHPQMLADASRFPDREESVDCALTLRRNIMSGLLSSTEMTDLFEGVEDLYLRLLRFVRGHDLANDEDKHSKTDWHKIIHQSVKATEDFNEKIAASDSAILALSSSFQSVADDIADSSPNVMAGSADQSVTWLELDNAIRTSTGTCVACRRLIRSTHTNSRFWIAYTGPELVQDDSELIGHTADITACQDYENGSRLISCSLDTTLRVWDISSTEPQLLSMLEGHNMGVSNFVLFGKTKKCSHFQVTSLTYGISMMIQPLIQQSSRHEVGFN